MLEEQNWLVTLDIGRLTWWYDSAVPMRLRYITMHRRNAIRSGTCNQKIAGTWGDVLAEKTSWAAVLRTRRRTVLRRSEMMLRTFRWQQVTSTRYLGPLDRVADLHGRQALHSASSSRLLVPTFRLSTVSSRTFNVSGPRIWNILPEDVLSAPT